ncbi:hypothetical protein J4573_01080 [Actinomadura barringtoniae]|uniref:Uncharacterized protein n=1 Tax=Actinomadura barringtoniae TaxID=1427535 RepID=A0A939T1Z4_9ACTN|nr:pectin acetylesterase-family hydrolase [Actinomadura barringtoniae]MBO2445673.1 hypothetical protein [Actinomadura barringtoniae]
MDETRVGKRVLWGWGLAALVIAVLLVIGGTLAFRGGGAGAVASPSVNVTVATHKWKQVVPGGDCKCANGSAFSFWERQADPTKVVLFLDGGGVCWDAAMCKFVSTDSEGENDLYNWDGRAGEDPGSQTGFFDLGRPDNPFSGYSILYASGCTGDAFLGNAAQKLSPTLTVQHRGYVNGTAALDHLVRQYPHAVQVVVIGKTAGSISAPIYGGLVAERLPHAKVTVFGAQSGAWPDNPDFNAKVLGKAWGAYAAMPRWAVGGMAVRDWGIPRLSIQAGRHAPNIVLARFDYAFDPAASREVTRWMRKDSLAVIKENEAAIEAAGVNVHGYTAPGKRHGLFEFQTFYDLDVGGVKLVDWLRQLISGTAPGDVR